jgi:rhomboid protease GluP
VDEDTPWFTGLVLAAIGYVAWQVTGFVPTEATLSPVWFSTETLQAGEWHRLLTSIVAHGGPLHLIFNTIAIVSLARLEGRLSSLTYAVVFLASGVAGNLAHVLVRTQPVVGASGAIFGMLGVLLALAPATRLFFFGLPVPAAILLPGYAAVVLLVPGLEQLAPIAHFAHLDCRTCFAYALAPVSGDRARSPERTSPEGSCD